MDHSKINNSIKFLSEVGVSSGAATEIRKHNSNDGKCGDLGWVCIPLVVETYGVWGQEAVKSSAQLASRLAITFSKPASVILHDLHGSALLDLWHWPSLVALCSYVIVLIYCVHNLH